MINGVHGGASLAREAIEAALKAQAAAASQVSDATSTLAPGGMGAMEPAQNTRGIPDFSSQLTQRLADVDRAVQGSLELPSDLAAGKVRDFHEVATQLKQAELTFKFALEVRNKLIDAYRETMRMSL